jgi:ATP-dependent protease ClpP protease subunit
LGNNLEVSEILEHRTATKFTNRVMGNTVFMLVNKQIGFDDSEPNEPFIDGPAFAEEVYYWKAQGKTVMVKINSPGGRVVQGWDMIDAIIECCADTMNTGIAYSMGGICLIAGKHRTAYEHSSAMIHAPHNKQGRVLASTEAIKNSFRALLSSRTKFTKAEIDDMVDSGKDYFFNAKEMLKKGMIDEIIPSDVNVAPPTYASAKDLCAFYNQYEQNETKMENKSAFTGLWAKLTGKTDESEQIVAFTGMQEEVKTLKASVSAKDVELIALKAKVTELEGASKLNDAKVKAEALIAGAEKAGKFVGIKAEDRVKLIENAVANHDTVKMMIDSMPSGKIVAAAAVIDKDGKEIKITYEHLAKNNPKELNRIALEDPELFNKLSDEYIASKNEVKETK